MSDEVKIHINADPAYQYGMDVSAFMQDGELRLAVSELAHARGRISLIQGADAGIADFGREHLFRPQPPKSQAQVMYEAYAGLQTARMKDWHVLTSRQQKRWEDIVKVTEIIKDDS